MARGKSAAGAAPDMESSDPVDMAAGTLDAIRTALATGTDTQNEGDLVTMTEVGADRPATSPQPAGDGDDFEEQGDGKPAAPTAPAATAPGEPPPVVLGADGQPLIDVTQALKPADPQADKAKQEAELYVEPDEIKGNPKARERFQQLVTRTKEAHAQLQQIRPAFEAERTAHAHLREAVNSFQAAPDELDRLARFSRSLKSGTPEGLQYAYKEIEEFRNTIAAMLGIRTETVDPLQQHPDLAENVRTLVMSREVALAEARRRNEGNLAQQAASREADAARATAAAGQMRSAVVGEIQRHELAWMQEPDYQAPVFVGPDGQPASMRDLCAHYTTAITRHVVSNGLDPRAIPGYVADYKRQLTELVRAQRATPAGPLRTRDYQPMRTGSGMAGTRQAAPQSTLDAIRYELHGG